PHSGLPVLPPSPSPTLFPYTTLFRSYDHRAAGGGAAGQVLAEKGTDLEAVAPLVLGAVHRLVLCRLDEPLTEALGLATLAVTGADRKSTRLNSSHAKISYAVFCLKKQ